MAKKTFDRDAWKLKKFGAEGIAANQAAAAELDERLARRKHMISALRNAGYSAAEADSIVYSSSEAREAERSDEAMQAFLAAETQAQENG